MKLLPAVLLLLSLLPAFAGAICQPGENMSKGEVLAACGPPDYAEIVCGKTPDTAIPLATDDAALLADGHATVVWYYAPSDGEEGRIILFRNGRMVKWCLPQRHEMTSLPWQLLFPPR